MNMATWSIRNPIPSIILFIILSIAGFLGFRALGVQDFVDLDYPAVSITLILPGAAPAQIESEVLRKVEDSVATLRGIKHIISNVTEGQTNIIAEFAISRDANEIATEVKDAIDKIRGDLPTDLRDPIVSKVDIAGVMSTYAVTSTKLDEEGLSWFIDDVIAKYILTVKGVGKFSRVGGVQREVVVEVDPDKMAALGITAADISRALKSMQQNTSGGRGQLGGTEQGIRTIGSVQQAQELRDLPITLAQGRWVRLDEVATVQDTVAERSQAAFLNGKKAVGFEISRSKGYDELKLAAAVQESIQKLEVEYPDLKVELVSTSATNTSQQFESSMNMLYEGAILAIIVVWWFLRDWRATLLGAIALPLSILPAFAYMAWAGFTLNLISLLAISVVVGILVDDAIVEVENIARHLRMGKSVWQATIDAVDEIALPVIATTFALVVVFLPTAMMGGVTGKVFKQFGWTAVAAILASLLVARLATPMMSVFLLKANHNKGHDEDKVSPIMKTYLKMVRWCLHFPKTTMLGMVVVLVFSLCLVPLLPTGVIAAGDVGYTTVSYELPAGSNIDMTIQVAKEAREVILGTPGVKNIFAVIGGSVAAGKTFGAAGEVRKGNITLTFGDRRNRPSQSEIENLVRKKLEIIPGARFSLGTGNMGQKLTLVLAGRDSRMLNMSGRAAESDFRKLPYLGSIQSTASLDRQEIVVRPDPIRAAELGVSTESIGDTIRVATSGDFDAALSKLNLDNRQIDIRVRMPQQLRTDLNTISDMRVLSKNGLIPLGSVAQVSIESGPVQIDRLDRERIVNVSADLGGYSLGDALKAVKELPAIKNLPHGVRLLESGDAEIMAELFGNFGGALLIGVLCVYAVLVLLFKDFFQPITILSAAPLSIGGAFIALLLTGSELGLPALIGLIMLLGIVTKNSILLVEYAMLAMREHGLSQLDALVDACHKRVRPIMMTTIAMIAGMIPLALGLSGDNSFRQPMAVAIIGGLITSTLLSLLVVPVVFVYIAKLKQLARRSVMKSSAREPITHH